MKNQQETTQTSNTKMELYIMKELFKVTIRLMKPLNTETEMKTNQPRRKSMRLLKAKSKQKLKI